MEARQLKRDVEALIDDYIGQKLREKSFDPKGKKGTSTMDDLAHYDLAVRVALWWLDTDEGREVLDGDIVSGGARYPDRSEREAMILSSFAGIIMGAIVYPFTLSYHPFAMLGSYKAVYHSRKHKISPKVVYKK
uniref:Uncharacterized protein n=1 Tax=Cyclopterus lumpus TaxID=8103 RepID=A0A8C3FXT6_CYCLU